MTSGDSVPGSVTLHILLMALALQPCAAVMAAEEAPACDAEREQEACSVSRGSMLLQMVQNRSRPSVALAEDEGDFCCWAADNVIDFCGTCKSVAGASNWCALSKSNCEQCSGGEAKWCTQQLSSPTPAPAQEPQHGATDFCCYSARVPSNACATCNYVAEATNWCAQSQANCGQCSGGTAIWCTSDGAPSVTQHPTALPGPPAGPSAAPTTAPTTQAPVPASTTPAPAATSAAPVPVQTQPPTTAAPAPASTAPPAVSPTSAPAPSSTAAPVPADVWDGTNMKMTHYWDCSGQGCDAATLQPWDEHKYISPPGYGPQDPADFGGALFGEKMWLTGAASDALSGLMGPDDGCCGEDPNDGGVGGCGKCALVQNPDSRHPDWTAVVMKKNRCPPWSNGCGAGEPHFDVAAPGFDNLQWSTANVCGIRPGTGFANQGQSEALGSWWSRCADTSECAELCNELPADFRKGCRLFASWGWHRGNPDRVKFRAVECPAAFVGHVASLFGASGPAAR
mmetsp:Transcript_42975/g.133135  ORF Transcript_42975/g.133135 Transcript_42975/m.133135 type:complete len:511 (+) Transcript_42975:57-1589(+)